MEIPRPFALVDIGGTAIPDGSDAGLLEANYQDGVLTTDIRPDIETLLKNYAAGAIPYEAMVAQMMHTYAYGLRGSYAADVQASTDRFFSGVEFFGYVEPTLGELAVTHEVMLVTGAAQFTAVAVANRLNTPDQTLVHGFVSTRIGVSDGIVNGRADVLASSEDKRRRIVELEEAGRGTLKRSFGLGNETADLGMLGLVSNPVCIRPSADLETAALGYGWNIVNAEHELASPAGLQVVRLALAESSL